MGSGAVVDTKAIVRTAALLILAGSLVSRGDGGFVVAGPAESTPTPQATRVARDASSVLAGEAASGRLDEALRVDIAMGSPIEAIVLFEDTTVLSRAAGRRAASRLREENSVSLAAKRNDYRSLKQGAVGPGATVLHDYEYLGVQHVRFDTPGALAATLQDPRVRAIRKVERYELALTESLPLIQQPQAAAFGYTGEGTTVATLDTGVDYTRSAFGPCTAPNTPAGSCKVAVSLDIATDDGQLDDNGHGTNVAGIVLGVAPGARVISLDVFQYFSGNWSASDPDIHSAIDWVIANRDLYNIRALNMSLANTSSYFTSPCSFSGYLSDFANLRSSGVLPVVAAGNEAYRFRFGPFENGIASPACTPGAVSVGAVYDSNVGSASWTVCSDLSTAADKITCFSQSASYLSILAPGSPITAAGKTSSGTSQATPHVAGAVAVLASANPLLGVDAWEYALVNNGPLITDFRNGVTKRRLSLLQSVCAISPCGGTPTATLPPLVPTATATPTATPTSTPTFGPSTVSLVYLVEPTSVTPSPTASATPSPTTTP